MIASEALYVRGEIPRELSGSLLAACSRRHKDRSLFSRWHDSQTDLVRIDLVPGRPGRAVARVFPVDPLARDVGGSLRHPNGNAAALESDPRYGYATQPNHAINVAGDRLWATNLLFGCPLEMDLRRWKATRLLRHLEPTVAAPRITGTAHFAWSLDKRYAYYEQSLLTDATPGCAAKSSELRIIRLDTATGRERIWALLPPIGEPDLEAANFHSAFYFEQDARNYLGLVRTGAVIESLAPHRTPSEHSVSPMPVSTIWIIEIDDALDTLRAHTLPGIREVDGLALSHLDVDNADGDGFVLYANYKEADVAEETHGINIYGERPDQVKEHYSGMTVEPINVGQLIRVEHRKGRTQITKFKRGYNAGRTSLGHTWLPINIHLDSSRKSLFCSFAGFHPRLLPRHVARAYGSRAIAPRSIRYVPPLLMRFDAARLEPDYSKRQDYLSYAEPMGMCVVGDSATGYVCTFSPELGVRIYRACDLSSMVAHVTAHPIWHYKDTHFRPAPAHLSFVSH